MSQPIPVARPDLTGNEEAYVVDAIRSTWISSSGKYLDRFEEQFAALCDTRTAIGVPNGTIALHLALLALGVRPGDEVLVPSLTFIATANAVRYVGGVPVFVDVDPDTWCIDARQLEDAIGPRTVGIIPVHLYGHPAEMDEINRIAAIHGLWVVEDAAEAHLARYKGRPVGGLAQIGTFSFYGNKIFTSGEGGAVTVSDPALEVRLRTLRGQGMDPKRRYYFPVTGYNFRMTNLAAALLCAQLERKDAILAHRKRIAAHYARCFNEVAGLGLQPAAAWAEPAQWLYCITIDGNEFGMTRDQVAEELAAKGIETRPFFIPLHRLPPFKETSRVRRYELPITDRLAATGLNLPTFSGLTEGEIDRVADAVLSLAR
jgi:perosamine synthetase